MKKIIAALFTITLVFSPIGDFVFQDQVTTTEAKSYKSGKKSFNPGNSGINSNNNNSLFQNNKKLLITINLPRQNTNNKGGLMSGGLMKGLMLGGLAGLLFVGLLGNMGILGSLIGLIVNGLAIVFLIFIVAKIFNFFKRKNEVSNAWRS